MAGWATMKNQQIPNLKGFDENDLMIGVMKRGIDLIQNCDLPPPMKLFSGSDNKTVINSMNRKKISKLMVNNEEIDDEEGKLELLKALRLSQTRAREAESKYTAINKEKESLVFAFVEDSMQVFGYRQLIRLLEFEISKLQKNKVYCDCWKREKDGGEEEEGDGGSGLTWIMAVAFCLGIAGLGFAFGCKYYYCCYI